jgi:hypothetical protein
VGRMGRTAVLSGNWYVFYWLTVIQVLIISRGGLPPEVRGKGILRSSAKRRSEKFAARSSHLADAPILACLLR